LCKSKRSEDFLLLDKYLRGDKSAGEELFGSIYPIVRKYVFSQTNADIYLGENDKEDIIADAMMRAIEKQHLFDGSSKFSTFVIGFSKNIIFEKRKKSTNQSAKIVSLEAALHFENVNFF